MSGRTGEGLGAGWAMAVEASKLEVLQWAGAEGETGAEQLCPWERSISALLHVQIILKQQGCS